MIRVLNLALLVVYWISLAHSQEGPHMFCRNPNNSNYTVIQDPFFGDKDVGQPGIMLHTIYGERDPRWFMVYQNGIDFKPYRAIRIPSNTAVFVDLTTFCRSFAGRIVRGADVNFDGQAHNLGTWVEINWENYPNTYGGVSVIEGNDGPILLQSEDKDTPIMGFAVDLIPSAPEECKISKDSGAAGLKPTDKDGYDEKTREFTMGFLDDEKVSIHKNHTATVMSHNGRFKVTFLYGYH